MTPLTSHKVQNSLDIVSVGRSICSVRKSDEVEQRLSKERKDKQKTGYLAGRVTTSRGRVSRPYVAADMEY